MLAGTLIETVKYPCAFGLNEFDNVAETGAARQNDSKAAFRLDFETDPASPEAAPDTVGDSLAGQSDRIGSWIVLFPEHISYILNN